MKRSPIARTTPLQRGTQLRAKRRRPVPADPARAAWKAPQAGLCQCGCNPPVYSDHLERHHVIELQTCKREGLPLWDLDNSMLLAPLHHARHTSAFQRIPVEAIPEAALKFAVEHLGEHRSALYLARRYRAETTIPRRVMQ